MSLAHQSCRLQVPCPKAAEVLAAVAFVVDAVPDVVAAGLTSASARGSFMLAKKQTFLS